MIDKKTNSNKKEIDTEIDYLFLKFITKLDKNIELYYNNIQKYEYYHYECVPSFLFKFSFKKGTI